MRVGRKNEGVNKKYEEKRDAMREWSRDRNEAPICEALLVSQNAEKVAQSEDVRAHVSFNPLIRRCPTKALPQALQPQLWTFKTATCRHKNEYELKNETNEIFHPLIDS